ncbi:MAG TPA: homoserine kinase [Methylophilaceae bacterium]|nr:homoserine kinase [Methylophilaceae bacterium]
MSVFTTVTTEELQQWLKAYPLGELRELKGIAAGITNTNYFVTTDSGRYVLTLFERNAADELPYFLDLMAHLSDHGVPCPHPVADEHGHSLGELNGKPAALVTCLRGKDVAQPSLAQCGAVGRVLAQLHLAGRSFGQHMDNPRDKDWRKATAESVMRFLNEEDRLVLQAELDYEASLDLDALPHGVIHADLFRDNVLFDGDALGGLIDFYYACNDVLLYDVAIAANDWCVTADGAFDEPRLQALLRAYDGARPFTSAEREAWPSVLRMAALRFWLSRLYDLHYPQDGELTHAKDPQHFQRILKLRIQQPTTMQLDA